MSQLTEKVTIERPVPTAIADLVYFVKRLRERRGQGVMHMTDQELIEAARDFWDDRHGEE